MTEQSRSFDGAPTSEKKTASNATLEQIGKLPKLRLLMLIQGTFDGAGVKHLAGLTTLEELTLNSAKVTDASIEHLAGLKYLRKLNIGGTKLTAEGRQKLVELLPKAKDLAENAKHVVAQRQGASSLVR